MVFATGMALEESDISDLEAQSIYGIWDRTDTSNNRVGTDPFSTVDSAELQVQNVDVSSRFGNLFGISDNAIDWNTQRGWRMPLGWLNGQSQGERSIADVQNIDRKVLITTIELHPASSTEMCTTSDLPGNFIYLLDAQTASQSKSRSFVDPRTGQLGDFAVMYRPGGGFSRGVSVTTTKTTSDGTPLVGDPWTIEGSAANPELPQDSSRTPIGVGAHGEYPGVDPASQNPCTNLRGTILGTAAEAVQFGTECPVSSWTRTQFQLSAPPSN